MYEECRPESLSTCRIRHVAARSSLAGWQVGRSVMQGARWLSLVYLEWGNGRDFIGGIETRGDFSIIEVPLVITSEGTMARAWVV